MYAPVEAKVVISTSDLRLLEAIKRALAPDNKNTPPGMIVEDSIRILNAEYEYNIKISVKGDSLLVSILRTRSTVDEILSITNMLLKQLKTLYAES
ncbi:MAG: hypothetical protein QXT64_03315 [Desulfurococcaceae archaeon]